MDRTARARVSNSAGGCRGAAHELIRNASRTTDRCACAARTASRRSARVDDEAQEHHALVAATYVTAATHSALGLLAVKSRLTRSRLRVATGSGVVVRHGLPRCVAPRMSCSRTRRLTRSGPTNSQRAAVPGTSSDRCRRSGWRRSSPICSTKRHRPRRARSVGLRSGGRKRTPPSKNRPIGSTTKRPWCSST